MQTTSKVKLLFIDEHENYNQRLGQNLIPTQLFNCQCVSEADIPRLKEIIQANYENDDKILILVHPFRDARLNWDAILLKNITELEDTLPNVGFVVTTLTEQHVVKAKVGKYKVLAYHEIKKYVYDNSNTIPTKEQILDSTIPKSLYLFISHANNDKQIAQVFMDEILVKGYNLDKEKHIFFSGQASTGLSYGVDINDDLRVALKKMTHFIQFSSPSYFKSAYCLCELGAAWVTLEKSKILNIKLPIGNTPESKKSKAVNSNGRYISLLNQEDLQSLYMKYFKDDFIKFEHSPGMAHLAAGISSCISFCQKHFRKKKGLKKDRSIK